MTNDDKPGDFGGDITARATLARLAIRSTLTAKAPYATTYTTTHQESTPNRAVSG
ncbi:hypothetical protein [Phytohabitans suffuscus]|uniref:hypothetical protein n=1 Tax=Phytohabitans suffuscus TaxID=624315 RepID=UPI0015671A9B|nr:hypothetical protein [Phytohabitans suffuscus]